MVVAIKFARLAEQGMLPSENPAATPDGQGSGDLGGYARLEALRCAHPRGSAPTASEALGGAGATG